MIKLFCDCCDAEITPANALAGSKAPNPVSSSRLGGKAGRLEFEVTTAIDGTWNAGHVCKYCVIDAVNRLDDRPRAA